MNKKNYLIFRKPKPEFNSIENVFNTVCLFLKNDIQKVELPYFSDGIIQRLKNIRFVRTLPAKLIHITGHDHYLILGLFNKKTILTIHDTEILRRNKGLKRFLLKKIWFDWPIHNATTVTSISDFTRQELIKLGNYTTSIITINNPLTLPLIYQPKEFNTNKPNLLQIGIKANKNLFRLIEALNGINCHLTIIAKPNQKLIEALTKNGISYIFKSGLTNEEMIKEYYNCDMVTFVSTYEGFGLPIIEAQAAGRPVITSNISSMPEIANNSALLVNPYKIEEIKEGILKLINDENLRNNFIQKGLKNVERFKPEVIAKEYLKLYQKIGNEIAN